MHDLFIGVEMGRILTVTVLQWERVFTVSSFLGPAQPLPLPAAAPEASQDPVPLNKPPRELQKSTCGLASEIPPPYPGLEQQQGSGSSVRSSRTKAAASQRLPASAAGRTSNMVHDVPTHLSVPFFPLTYKVLRGEKYYLCFIDVLRFQSDIDELLLPVWDNRDCIRG